MQGRRAIPYKDERGYTLTEVMTAVAIFVLLLAIAIIVILALLERWRVDAATNQLVADMRLAHTSATEQLTDWRVVLVPDRYDEDEGPDYYMVRLAVPYGDSSGKATKPQLDPETPPEPRTFPGNVRAMNISGKTDNQSKGWWLRPWAESGSDPPTRTVEFNTDGAMWVSGAVSGSTCVTVDENPENKLTVTSATSRVKIKPNEC